MRSVGSATVSFGLISIPTKAYLTASAERMSFNMITKKGNRVKQQLVDSETGEEVDRKSTDHGYEVKKGEYVIFTDEELKSFEGEKSNVIEICSFVKDFKITPVQVEKAYYLAPDKNADKAYKLLVRALEKSNKVAICKWYSRGRDHLVALTPVGDILMMFQMFYASEIRDFQPEFVKNTEPSDREIELANKLMEQLSDDKFDITTFKDQYSERIREAIAKKQNGEAIAIAEKPANDGGAFDLAALLESSLK